MDEVLQKVGALSCFSNPHDVVKLGGGLTNINLLVHDGGKKFVVRLGEDIPEHGVMRWNELVISKAASVAGFSPEVMHSEKGVMVIGFIDGQTFKEADVRKPENLFRIVDMMGKAHREIGTCLTQPIVAFWPYHVNRSYIERLALDGSVHQKALPALRAQNNTLEKATGPVDLVVGHNDLLAANIIDDGDRLWLIDWEYGGFNSPLFDLAGLASNNGLAEDQERSMITQYFDSDADLHWRSFSALKCASLMRETLWSMTSEIHSEIKEDFGKYTYENMEKLKSALAEFGQI